MNRYEEIQHTVLSTIEFAPYDVFFSQNANWLNKIIVIIYSQSLAE